jgi:PAS domain S-box-containing protein
VNQCGAIVYVNPAAVSLLGVRSAEDILGKPALDFIHPNYHDVVQRRLKNMLEGHVSGMEEEVFLRPDGTCVSVEVTSWPIPLEGGAAVRVSFVDISARLDAERRLRNSVDRFRKIITQAPFPMILHAEDGTILQVSNTLTELTGYGLDDIPTIEAWTDKAYRERASEVRNRVTSLYGLERRVDMGEFTVHTADNGVRHWTFITAPVGVDEVGRRLVLSVASDVTGRNRTELALRASEARFRGTFEQAAVGIAHVSLEGRWLRVNRRFTEIVGYSEDELLGRTFADITHPEDLDADLKQLDALLVGRIITYSMEKRYLRQGNSCVWVNLTVSLVRKENRQPDYLISVIEDITRRKAAEEQVLEFSGMLERKVEERTRQLREANQELEAFAYSVSHDLRGPLRAIEGFSQILLMEKAEALDPEARSYLDQVIASSLRMSELIEDILVLSRVNRAPLSIHAVNLSALAQQVMQALQSGDRERFVQVEIQPDIIVQADERLLQIVLENLLGNAWKYTSKTASPFIQVGVTDDPHQGTVIHVRDNGAGFNMKHSAKLFRPFQRLHRTSEFEGTGIGLATVRRILHRHNGTIWAEGEPGLGATFYLTFRPEERDVEVDSAD